ncbi:hypothetical protein ES702_02817 [subsurface metagenome]
MGGQIGGGLEGISGGGDDSVPNIYDIYFTQTEEIDIPNTHLQTNPLIFAEWQNVGNVVEGFQMINFIYNLKASGIGKTSVNTSEIFWGLMETEDGGANWQAPSFNGMLRVDSNNVWERMSGEWSGYTIVPSDSPNYRLGIGAFWDGANVLTGSIKNCSVAMKLFAPLNTTWTRTI